VSLAEVNGVLVASFWAVIAALAENLLRETISLEENPVQESVF